jgi:hypothetical protein
MLLLFGLQIDRSNQRQHFTDTLARHEFLPVNDRLAA